MERTLLSHLRTRLAGEALQVEVDGLQVRVSPCGGKLCVWRRGAGWAPDEASEAEGRRVMLPLGWKLETAWEGQYLIATRVAWDWNAEWPAWVNEVAELCANARHPLHSETYSRIATLALARDVHWRAVSASEEELVLAFVRRAEWVPPSGDDTPPWEDDEPQRERPEIPLWDAAGD